MSRHAPLYGAGLEALSMKELNTLYRIHEEGLRQIHAIQHRKGSTCGNPLVIPHSHPHSHGLYPSAPPAVALGLPPSLVPNGIGSHGNGYMNGAVRPWFSHSSISFTTTKIIIVIPNSMLVANTSWIDGQTLIATSTGVTTNWMRKI